MSEDGMINFPSVGRIEAEGLTLAELEDAFYERIL